MGYGGGYGMGYGGGYGSDGAMGGAVGGAMGGGWMDSIQRTLHGFGQFSQLLDGSYFSMHESFMSLMDFLQVIGELRHHVLFVVKAVAAVMLLQVTGRSIKDFVTGGGRDGSLVGAGSVAEDLASFRSFAPGKRPSVWPKVLLVAGLLAVFGPFLWRRLFGAHRPAKKLPPRKVVAVYDYKAETPEELSLRTGDLIVVEDERSSAEWWKGTDPRGNRGFFPSAFCETMIDEEDEEEGGAKRGKKEGEEEEEEEEELDEEAKAQRKRCMEIVRERRRRDRESAASSSGGRMRPSLAQSQGPRRRVSMYEDDLEEDERARRLSYSNPVY